MATFPEVSVTDLENAYQAWPGGDDDKGRLRALILRVRIERAVSRLPATIIAAPPDTSHIERRLYLSTGEPGLTPKQQAHRTAVVIAAVGAYKSICDLLHGRNFDPNPPRQEVDAWMSIVGALEHELGGSQPFIGSISLPMQTAVGAHA